MPRTRSFFVATFRPLCLVLLLLVLGACGSAEQTPPASSDGDADTEAAESDTESESSEADSEESDPVAAFYAGLSAGPGPDLRHRLGVASQMTQRAGKDADQDFEYSVYKELNKDGGSVTMRNGMDWNSIERSKGVWTMEGLDQYVQGAIDSGTNLIAPLDYAADWAVTDSDTSTLKPEDFAAYATKVASSYCPKGVKQYEIWNEENLSMFWHPAPNAAAYGTILKAAYTAIKAVCPDAVVSIGGMCSMTFNDFKLPRWYFMEDLYTAHPDICSYFDALALHPYTFAQAYTPERDYRITSDIMAENQNESVALARQKLAKLGCPNREIWFTEFGWPSYDLTQLQQADYLARSVLMAMHDDVRSMAWYTFYDFEPQPDSIRPHEQHFGLYEWPGKDGSNRKPKPAFAAFKGLWNVLGTSRFAGDLSGVLGLPAKVFVYAFLSDTGALTLAVWDGREMPDGKLGDGQKDNPDTRYELVLPLPAWAAKVVRLDQSGAKQEEAAPQNGAITLTLTGEVQYLQVSH